MCEWRVGGVAWRFFEQLGKYLPLYSKQIIMSLAISQSYKGVKQRQKKFHSPLHHRNVDIADPRSQGDHKVASS